jgi:transcriptional regulator with GAF, ATPase, and Fis domain/CHASE2 domain-containing sensor protein
MLKMKKSLFEKILILAAVLIFGSLLPFLGKFDQPLQDEFLRLSARETLPAPVSLMLFSEKDLQQLGGWPVSRNIYGYLIYLLKQLDVRVIGFDLFFAEKSKFPDEDDQFLVQACEPGQVVNSCYFSGAAAPENPMPPDTAFANFKNAPRAPWPLMLPFSALWQQNSALGFSNLIPEEDGAIRRTHLLQTQGEQVVPAFALKIAATFAGGNSPQIQSLLKNLPANGFWIHFQIKPENLPVISPLQFIHQVQQGTVPEATRAAIAGKIVLVGIASENLGSFKTVPVSAVFPVTAIHAQIIANILNHDFLRPVGVWPAWVIFVLWGGLYGMLKRRKFWQQLVTLLVAGILLSAGALLLIQQNLLLPVSGIFLGALLWAGVGTVLQSRDWTARFNQATGKWQALEAELAAKSAQMMQLKAALAGGKGSEATLKTKLETYRQEIFRLQKQLQEQVPAESKITTIPAQTAFPEILCAENSPLLPVLRQVQRVAPTNTTVLIQGESGTGKELIARALHQNSPRSGGPFLAFNCAALVENLVESELFGHEKGAFTGAIQTRKGLFEMARGGTLFLDEITETSPAFQSKLLRVLQEREFSRVGSRQVIRADVRIIAASNQPVKTCVADGRFREDLFYRLSVILLEIPPLRQRSGDIPLLIAHFCPDGGKQFSADALELLQQYPWPGNVRELQNLVERARLLSETRVISAEWLQGQLEFRPPSGANADSLGAQILEKWRAREFHFSAISAIAGELGNLHRSTVTEHLKGIIFQAFFENGFDELRTVRALNPAPAEELDRRLQKRIHTYLQNLKNSLLPTLSVDENLVQRRSQLKNLPQKYHFYFEELVRAALEKRW